MLNESSIIFCPSQYHFLIGQFGHGKLSFILLS